LIKQQRESSLPAGLISTDKSANQSSILAQRNNTSTNLEKKNNFSKQRASRGGHNEMNNSDAFALMNSMSEHSKQSDVPPPKKQHKNNSFSI